MHEIESYANNLSLKIDRPEIYEKYYPMSYDKFITVYLGEGRDLPFYRNWADVINLCFPILEKEGIKIILLNSNIKHKFNNCINFENALDHSSLSYIIKNSLLHVSENGIDLEIASMHDKNIVYIDTENNNNYPYWNKESSYDRFSGDINKIKPEEISKSIFNFLNLKFKINFETVFIGDNYQNKSIQFVPDQQADIDADSGNVILVRMDKYFNEQNLAKQLSKFKCVIVTNKRINLNLLNQFKQNVHHMAFFLEKNDDPDFIDEIQSMGIQYNIMTYLSEEETNLKKINYLDNDIINNIKIPKKEDIEELKDLDIDSLYYISNGPVLSNFKVYKSICDYENRNDVENPQQPTQIKQNEDFWKEVQNFHILKMLDTNSN